MPVKFDPPLTLRGLLAATPGLPEGFPFRQPNLRPCYSGRYALFAAIKALGLSAGSEALLPAYQCGTEVEPFVRAGLRASFYRVGRDLACDTAHLAALLSQGRGPRVVLLTHYFGLPQPRVAEVAALCRQSGAYLIEDCAHALLSEHQGRPLGSWGEAAVFSLIKPLPLPDGGLLLVNRPPSEPPPADPIDPPAALTQHTLARLWRHNHPAQGRLEGLPRLALERCLAARRRLWERLGRKAPPRGVDPRSLAFLPEVATWGMSGAAWRILATCDLTQVKAARRRNFAWLLAHFREHRPGSLLVSELGEGACPLCFPVRVRRPPQLFARLMAARGVEACPWWGEFHPAPHWRDFPEAAALKRRTLALPVHQGLGEDDLARLAAAFETACRLVG